MKTYKQKTWQYVTSGVEGNTTLFGVNIFGCEWKDSGQHVRVKDPIYNQEFVFSIYSVIINDEEYQFACGEFSNCVYGFYVEKY